MYNDGVMTKGLSTNCNYKAAVAVRQRAGTKLDEDTSIAQKESVRESFDEEASGMRTAILSGVLDSRIGELRKSKQSG